MEEFVLSEEEIKSIKEFLEEVRKNKKVVGVYMGAYHYVENGPEDIGELEIVVNPNRYYTIDSEEPIVIDEHYNEELERSIEKLKSKLDVKRIRIHQNPIEDYNIGLMHLREILKAKNLLSSKIILDEEHILGDLRNKLSQLELFWMNALTVEGIEPIKWKKSIKDLEQLNLEEKRIIIFDLDGTLIDSIGIWNQTDQQLIKDYSGIEVDQETVQKDRDDFLNNNNHKDIYVAYCDYLIKKYNLSVKDPNELSEIRRVVSNKILKNDIGFKPDVVELIKDFKSLGFTVALATITTSEQLKVYYEENKKMLEEMNIKEEFDFITTKDHVKMKKPHPEVYLTIMHYYRALPEECLIFEDSLSGVTAANKAGIEVVNIYDKYSDGERKEIDELTDYKIDNYREFIDKCIKRLQEKGFQNQKNDK